MEIAKYIAIFLQAASVSILALNFAGIRAESLPRILQPLFLVPWYFYAILFLILLMAIIATKEKIRQIGDAPPAPPALHKVDLVEYKGVNWDILAPARHPQETPENYTRRLPQIGEVRIPPKCPRCGVELEETKSMMFWHRWRCVACGFSKRNRDTYATEAVRAGKIWKGKVEAAAEAAPVPPANPQDGRAQ